MNRNQFFAKIAVFVFAIVGFLFTPLAAFATVTITAATTTNPISADTTGGSYTAVTGPTITEGAYRDFSSSSFPKTFILNVPTGFQFNTGSNVTATITRVAGVGTCFNFSALTVTPTASTITFSQSARDATTGTRCRVVFSGIQLRPTAGTPLASANMLTTGSTAVVVGITHGTTNIGTISETSGTKSKLTFTTEPSTTATANVEFTTKPTVRMEDQFGNPKTTDTSAVTLSAVSSGEACGGNPGTGSITSTPLSGANLVSGVIAYTAMKYSTAETIHVCAASSPVTPAKSNAITVSKITTTTALITSLTPQVYGTSVTFTATVTPANDGPATGTVTFKDGLTTIGTGALSGGVATYSTSTLSVLGSPHSITAVYEGSSTFLGSTSSAVGQTMTVKTLTVTGMTASDKEYDGGVTVTLSGGSLVGVVSGDTVSISARSGSFATKTAGTGKTVNVSSVTLMDSSAGNYTVTNPTGITANITAKNLTVTGMQATTKEYDGGITATLTGGSLVGVINPDVVSINTRTGTFATKTVGTGKSVNVSSVTITGDDSTNYTVSNPTDVTGDITAKALSVTGMTATTKEYDGGITATLTGGALVGVINPDVVSINTRAGTFATKTVGTNKAINVSSVTLSGTDNANYTVTNPTDAVGDITAKTISTTGVIADDKYYDGNDTAVINITGASLFGTISGDDVAISIAGAIATFNNSNVGLDKPVTITGLSLSGMDGTNYNLSQPSGITASIRYPVPVTTSINPASKESGESGFTLTVNGSGFVGVSSVKFNGSSRATTFVGPTQLTAEILTSDLLVATTSALITVTNPVPGGGTSNPQTFVVAHAATQFVILPPTNGTVDGSVVVTVQAQKANGVKDATFQDDVTLNVDGSATGAGLIDIVDGEGTLPISDHTAETVHLSLTDSQNTLLTVTSRQDLVFAPGAVTQFTLNDPGSTMNARTRLGYQITRKDQYGNSVLTGALTAYLYSNSTSTDHAFYSDSLGGEPKTSVDFSESSATASFWYYDDMPGTYTLKVSDHTPTPDGLAGIDDASRDITVVPVAVKFVIIATSSASVDGALTVTVQAQKVDNFVDDTFQDDVTLNSTGSVTGTGVVEIVNGVGTKNIYNTHVESTTLSLSDSQSTGLNVDSTANISWTGGVTTQVTLSHPATDLPAGTRTAYTLTRKDQHGNVTSLGETTVYLYSSSVSLNKKFYNAATDGEVISSVTIHDGSQSAQFWYYDEALGTWSITASDGTPIANGSSGISDAVDVLTVVTGPVSSFTLSTPGNMTAKTRLGYTVTRKDQFGNLVTSGDTTAYLSTSAGELGTVRFFYDAATNGSPITSRTISGGSSSATFWYYEENSGDYTVTASDVAGTPDGATGIIDGTRAIRVSPAPIVATRFVILPPATGNVDAPLTITIQAQDDNGSLDTTASSSVMLITTGSATGAGLVTMIEGEGAGTIQISDHTAETVHLSLSDTQNTHLDVSSSQDAVFTTGAAAQFSIDNPGDMAAGSRLGFIITRKDQFGNLITSGVTTADLGSSSLGENKKFYDAVSGGTVLTSVNFLEGQSTAQFWYYDELAGSATVTVSANGIISAYRTFTITPSAIAKFTLDDPGNMTQKTRLPYVITRKDAFNNLVTSGIVSAYLYSNSTGTTTTTTKFYDVVTGGSPISLVSFAEGSSIAHFWYYDETPGTWVVTASDGTPTANGTSGLQDAADAVTVTVSLINATRFVIHPVSNSDVNTAVTVTIRAEDDNGNVDTTNNQSITLVTSGSATGGGSITLINGVGTATVNDSVAETVTLSLIDTLSTGLNTTSSQTFSFIKGFVPPTIVYVAGETGAEYLTPVISGIRFSGKAFPGASLNIVAIGGTNSLANQKSTASTNGNFSISFGGLTSGATSYGIVGVDKNNNTTQVKIFDANKANSLLQLDVNGILLSPTIGLSRTAVTKGDVLGIAGAGAPTYKIEVQVDNQPIAVTAKVDSKGTYALLIPTMTLDFGSHTIRTRQISPSGLKSDYSPQEVFSVVNIFTPNLDFNSDGTIGVQDYSIFVSRWQSANAKLKAKDDLNGDGKVNVQDLSIFMRTLKK